MALASMAWAGLRDDITNPVHQFTDGLSSCSAVMITPDWALTAYHCMDMTSPVLVIQGTKYPALDGYGNPNLDLALINVPGAPCPCAKVIDVMPIPGDIVYIVGFPYGMAKVVTSGEVQGRVIIQGIEYVLTTAPARPGNSGGGVFNSRGELIGILVMGDTTGYLTMYVEIKPLFNPIVEEPEQPENRIQ